MAASNQNRMKACVQYAALPFRLVGDNAVEVMLITSRETHRWILPKGWPIKGLKPHETAACEAFEEAGLIGRITKHAIGSFRYEKRLKEGQSITCKVQIYPLEVLQQRETWPERHQRDGHWFSLADAAIVVEEAGLAAALLRLNSDTLQKRSASKDAKRTEKLIQRVCHT